MKRSRRQAFSIFALLLMVFSLMMPGVTQAQGEMTGNERVLYGNNSTTQEVKLTKGLLNEFEQKDKLTFLVKFKDKADTASAVEKAKENAKKLHLSGMNAEFSQRSAVVNELKATSMTAQQHVLKFLKNEKQVDKVESFYIVNAIKVTATKEVAEKIALFDEVEKILPNEKRQLFTPVAAETISTNHSAEGLQKDGLKDISLENNSEDNALNDLTPDWNVERVRAPEVWKMGINGNGTVVATIDSGVQWDHPALKEKYRGYNAVTGEVDHSYSWFDATVDAKTPYDDDGHGTHVTGTMVGSEGKNQVGMAPGAKWIAVKAFTASGGEDADLLAAAEWIMAPGGRVDLAPDIVNNSWGGGPGLDEWYRDVVIAWRDAGIFPVFAAGNVTADNRGGPGSVATPANYPESFAVGALDIADDLASFSLLGPSPYDEVKPDISAPGQVIRSSVPGNGYAEASGTSMAAPAVSGAAALILSANTTLSVDDLETILIETAKPLSDEKYPESPNNGYGYGLVDAQNAVLSIDQGVGTLQGTVTETSSGNPMQAEVSIVGGGRSVMSNPDNGFYSIRYASGQHTVRVAAYGYYTKESAVTINENEPIIVNYSMEKIPRASLTGTVVDKKTGQSIKDAIILLQEDANVVPVRSDSNGDFTLEAYEGNYTVKVSARGYKPQKVMVALDSKTGQQTIQLDPFYSYPGGELVYDDGTSEGGAWFLEAGNGWGVRMSLDEGKDQAMVTGAKFMFSNRGGTDFQFAVMDASGADGGPGKIIAGPFDGKADLTGKWQTFDISEYGILVEDDFYIVYLQTQDRANTPRLEQDKKGEWTSRSWEMYKGYWYQLEPNWLTGNKMIRAVVDYEIEKPVITSPVQNQVVTGSPITIEGKGSPTTDIEIHLNGEVAGKTTVDKDGSFAVNVKLMPGINELAAYSVKDGNVIGNSDTVKVVYIAEKPSITALYPGEDQYVVAGEEVKVRAETNVLFGDANFEVKLPLQNKTEQSTTGLKMNEVEPGVYEASWKVPSNVKVDGAVIDVSVTDLAGNVIHQEAVGKLYISDGQVERIAGEIRYDTAIEISRKGWAKADTVILARGLEFADALAGVPLAHKLDAPILLTPSDSLWESAHNEIDRLGAAKVIILGGESAVSSEVASQLEKAGLEVRRIAGKTRFETAALIAKEVAPNGASKVVVANGMDFPDALSVGSYAAKAGMPILLTMSKNLPSETTKMVTELGAVESIVVGGTSVISDDVANGLPNAKRVSGKDRYSTNVALANYFGLESSHVYAATGENYADALTGAVLAAKKDSAIMLVHQAVPEVLKEFLNTNEVKRLTIFGGESAVSTKVVRELQASIQ